MFYSVAHSQSRDWDEGFEQRARKGNPRGARDARWRRGLPLHVHALGPEAAEEPHGALRGGERGCRRLLARVEGAGAGEGLPEGQGGACGGGGDAAPAGAGPVGGGGEDGDAVEAGDAERVRDLCSEEGVVACGEQVLFALRDSTIETRLSWGG